MHSCPCVLSAYSYSSCCSNLRQRNTGNITLYSVSCSYQSRPFIQDCSYSIVSGYTSGTCNLQEELILGCYEQSSCTTGDIRLRGGNSTYEGRVEFCSQGLWGGIVSNHFYFIYLWRDWQAAMVVCRELGYPSECELKLIITLKTNPKLILYIPMLYTI